MPWRQGGNYAINLHKFSELFLGVFVFLSEDGKLSKIIH